MKTYAESGVASALKIVGMIILVANIIGGIVGSVPFYDHSDEEIGTVILLAGIFSGVVFGLVLYGLGELIRSTVNIERYLLKDEMDSKPTIANPTSNTPKAPRQTPLQPTRPTNSGNDTLPSI